MICGAQAEGFEPEPSPALSAWNAPVSFSFDQGERASGMVPLGGRQSRARNFSMSVEEELRVADQYT